MTGIFTNPGTDRNQINSANTGLGNIFNFGLSSGENAQSQGTSNLGAAGDFFTKALTAGRTDTAATAAPEINANLSAADAERKRQASGGTGRTGGVAEANREASATTAGKTDDLISQARIKSQNDAAKGLTQVGSTQLSNAVNQLGLGENAEGDVLKDNADLFKTDEQSQQAFGESLGSLAAGIFL